MSNRSVYLDYAAATRLDERVYKAMQPYLTDYFYNPSALYQAARDVRRIYETARVDIAKVLGAKPSEVIMTAGATESVNLAIRGLIQSTNYNLIVSAIEHESVLAAAKASDYKLKTVPVLATGLVDINHLEKLIDKDTALISIGYVNSEVGVIQPLRKIAHLVERIRQDRRRSGNKLPLFFHTDASQAASYCNLSVNSLGVDMMTLSASKIYGPKQVGCLFVKAGIKLQPIIYGGGQEKGLRSGTEDVAGAVGLAEALKIASTNCKTELKQLDGLRSRLLSAVLGKLKDISLNHDLSVSVPAFLNLSITRVNGETLVQYLDQAGFMISTGAACSANDDKPSHVLLALGLTKEAVNSSIRITLGRGTTKTDIDNFANALVENVGLLRKQAK